MKKKIFYFLLLFAGFCPNLAAQSTNDLNEISLPQNVESKIKRDPLYYTKSSAVLSPSHQGGRSYQLEFRLRRIIDNIDELELGEARFLSYEAVRNELGLSEAQKKKLERLVKELNRFEESSKWDVFSGCDQVKQEAELHIKGLSELTKKDGLSELLSVRQSTRLDQVQRRFYALGRGDRLPNYKKWIQAHLRLTTSQIDDIKRIVEEEMSDFQKPIFNLPEFQQFLSGELNQEIERYLKPFDTFEVPLPVLIAQTKSFHKLNEEPQNEFHPAIISGTVVIPNGKLCPTALYFERNATFNSYSTWQEVHRLIRENRMSWLELVEEQKNEILSLRKVVKKEGQPSSVQFVGHERIVETLRNKPATSCTVEQYRKWETQFVESKLAFEHELSSEMKESLLPDQLKTIKLAMAIDRYPEIGIGNLIIEQIMLPGKVAEKQIDQIQEMLEKRQRALQRSFHRIEKSVTRLLDENQADWFEKNFGDYCPLYPSVWVIFNF